MKYYVSVIFIISFSISGCGETPNIPPGYGDPFPPTALTPSPDIPFASESAPQSNKAITNQEAYCYYGPDEQYQKLYSLSLNTEVNILGINSDDGSWTFVKLNLQGTPSCWINTSALPHSINPDVVITVRTVQESACRLGPNENYFVQTRINQYRRVIVKGMSDLDGAWLFVIPPDSLEPCWVASYLLSYFDPFDIPVVAIPTPYPTFASVPGVGGGGSGDGGESSGSGGVGSGSNSCQNVLVCEDQITQIDVCVDWAGNSGNCKKWEKQDVVNSVCNTVCQ